LPMAAARADEPLLVVRVASGRQFRGVIDGNSSDDTLVLRTAIDGVTLRRSIRWEKIVAGTLDGQTVDMARIEELARDARVRSQGTGGRGQGSGVRKIEMRGVV